MDRTDRQTDRVTPWAPSRSQKRYTNGTCPIYKTETEVPNRVNVAHKLCHVILINISMQLSIHTLHLHSITLQLDRAYRKYLNSFTGVLVFSRKFKVVKNHFCILLSLRVHQEITNYLPKGTHQGRTLGGNLDFVDRQVCFIPF